VNVPNVPYSRVRGVKITHQGKMRAVETYDRRSDPRNNVYYWLRNKAILGDPHVEADSYVLAEDYISVTHIHHDLTDYVLLDTLKSWEL
jgi:5'-nucleotidase